MHVQRIILFGIGFFVALLVTLQVIRSELDAAGIEPLDTRHGVALYYRNQVNSFRKLQLPPETVRVAFLGDSMAVSYPPELQIPSQLQKDVALHTRGDPPIRIFNLALSGTGSFDYYLMADLISQVEPDLVVISFGMASAGRAFRDAFARPELAGWTDSSRVFETSLLPMNWIGLTLDKILFYRAIIQSGGFERWIAFNDEQTRVEVARGEVEKRLAVEGRNGKTPESLHEGRWSFYALKRNNKGFNNRYSVYGTRRSLGAVLDGIRPDHPTLVVLGATIRTFERKGIDTLVYLNPINIDHIRSLGILDDKGLARSAASIRSVVESNGGHFLDFLRIFPDELFRDQPGHFVYQDGINGPRRLAGRLSPTVVKLAREKVREQR